MGIRHGKLVLSPIANMKSTAATDKCEQAVIVETPTSNGDATNPSVTKVVDDKLNESSDNKTHAEESKKTSEETPQLNGGSGDVAADVKQDVAEAQDESGSKVEENGTHTNSSSNNNNEETLEKECKTKRVKKKRSFRSFSFLRREKKSESSKKANKSMDTDDKSEESTVNQNSTESEVTSPETENTESKVTADQTNLDETTATDDQPSEMSSAVVEAGRKVLDDVLERACDKATVISDGDEQQTADDICENGEKVVEKNGEQEEKHLAVSECPAKVEVQEESVGNSQGCVNGELSGENGNRLVVETGSAPIAEQVLVVT